MPTTDSPAVTDRRRARRSSPRPNSGVVLVGVLLVLVVGAVLFGGPLISDLGAGLRAPTCSVLGPGGATVELEPGQAANTATIAAVSLERGLPQRAAVIAIATAMQESELRNLDHGDRDSLGLFQQRPSQGWGSAEQVTDPVYAARQFYDRLVQVPGWQDGELTEVAQAVQRSGYPEAYAQHEGEATHLAQAFTGARAHAVACRLDPPSGVVDAEAISADLDRSFGVRSRVEDERITVGTDSERGSAAISEWAVAPAEAADIAAVSHDGRTWSRGQDSDSAWAADATRPSGPTSVVIDLATAPSA